MSKRKQTSLASAFSKAEKVAMQQEQSPYSKDGKAISSSAYLLGSEDAFPPKPRVIKLFLDDPSLYNSMSADENADLHAGSSLSPIDNPHSVASLESFIVWVEAHASPTFIPHKSVWNHLLELIYSSNSEGIIRRCLKTLNLFVDQRAPFFGWESWVPTAAHVITKDLNMCNKYGGFEHIHNSLKNSIPTAASSSSDEMELPPLLPSPFPSAAHSLYHIISVYPEEHITNTIRSHLLSKFYFHVFSKNEETERNAPAILMLQFLNISEMTGFQTEKFRNMMNTITLILQSGNDEPSLVAMNYLNLIFKSIHRLVPHKFHELNDSLQDTVLPRLLSIESRTFFMTHLNETFKQEFSKRMLLGEFIRDKRFGWQDNMGENFDAFFSDILMTNLQLLAKSKKQTSAANRTRHGKEIAQDSAKSEGNPDESRKNTLLKWETYVLMLHHFAFMQSTAEPGIPLGLDLTGDAATQPTTWKGVENFTRDTLPVRLDALVGQHGWCASNSSVTTNINAIIKICQNVIEFS